MRTLRGYEAIEIADRFNVLLYDLEDKTEVTADEARETVHLRQDINSFVIEDWPDTDEEAEQIVLKEFHRMLKEKRTSVARIFDISNRISGGLPIHLEAAELAAKRLVKQNKLEIVEAHKDYSVYQISRSVYFGDQFLDNLASVMCDECAELDFNGPFHETCLINLIDFIKNYDFTFADVTQVHQGKHPDGGLPKLIRPGIGIGWLSKTANATKLKWKNAIKPMFIQEHEDTIEEEQIEQSEYRDSEEQFAEKPQPVMEASGVEEDGITGKKQITKSELIRYLQSVEILEENGELDDLKQERIELLKQITAKEHEIEKAEKQRMFMEKQYEEMQRDMDILIQAMQITKRRDPSPVHVVEASFESER